METMTTVKSFEDIDRLYDNAVQDSDPCPVKWPAWKALFPAGEEHHLELVLTDLANGGHPTWYFEQYLPMLGGRVCNLVNPVGKAGGHCDQDGCAGTLRLDRYGEYVCDTCGVIAIDQARDTDDDGEVVGEPDYFYVVDRQLGSKLPRELQLMNLEVRDFEVNELPKLQEALGLTPTPVKVKHNKGYNKDRRNTRMHAEEQQLATVLALIKAGYNTPAKVKAVTGYDHKVITKVVAILTGERARLRTGKVGAPRVAINKANARVITYTLV